MRKVTLSPGETSLSWIRDRVQAYSEVLQAKVTFAVTDSRLRAADGYSTEKSTSGSWKVSWLHDHGPTTLP